MRFNGDRLAMYRRWVAYTQTRVSQGPNTRKHIPAQAYRTSTVLPYFSKSPFFDPMSNNATITTQATYNPNMFYLIQTREAFEARLRTMQGLEFMVTADPSENGTKSIENSVWVISKQNRRKMQGAEDVISSISSYFVVGENIYMAPVVGQILSARLVGQQCPSSQSFG